MNSSLQTVRPIDDGESRLWLPPRRLRRYQWFKTFGALVMAAVFTGWMVMYRSNPHVWIPLVLILMVTAWVLIKSITADLDRARHRQLAVDADQLIVTTPQGTRRVMWSHVLNARWCDEPINELGLWLYDRQGDVLTHLDQSFLIDQSEAQAFLAWARKRAVLDFEVQWPRIRVVPS